MKAKNNKKAEQISSELIKGQLRTNSADKYEIGQQYEGYLMFNEDGTINFRKKTRRVYRNGFVTLRTNDDFTIQKSEKFVKVTLVLDKNKLTFSQFMSLLTRLSITMDNLRLIPL